MSQIPYGTNIEDIPKRDLEQNGSNVVLENPILKRDGTWRKIANAAMDKEEAQTGEMRSSGIC